MSELDYRVTGKDIGNNEAAAIQPILNGEDANQTTFQRPSENLRTRSEVVRKVVDNILAEMQADRGLCVMSYTDAKVYFSSGKFRLNVLGTDTASTRDLTIAPIAGSFNGNPPPGSPIQAKYYYADAVGGGGQGKFQVVAKSTIQAYNGGNNLWFKIFKNGRTLGSPVVTIEGAGGSGSYPADGPVTICVEIDKDSLNTIDDVIAALILAPGATYLDTVLTQTIANGTNAVEERTQRIFSSDAGGMAAVDNECYRLRAADIDNFFQVLSKTMAEGDSLVIAFPTIAARRACTYSTVISGYMQIISEDSRTLANGHVVPICKMYLNRLIFLNGKIIDAGTSGADYLVNGPKLAAVDTLRTDLADTGGSPKGDYMIGSKAHAGTPYSLSLGTLDSQMTALIGDINSHIDGSVPAADHSLKYILNKPFVVVDKGGNGDFTTITAALSELATNQRGGTILVRAHSAVAYVENIQNQTPAFDINFPIDIVGVSGTGGSGGSPWVDVQPTYTTLPILHIVNSAPPTANALLRFHNIDFRQGGNSRLATIYGCDVEFHNCAFIRPAVTSNKAMFEMDAGKSLKFYDCYISSMDQTDDAPVFDFLGAQTACKIHLHRCKFYKVAELFRGSVSIENFIMEDCSFELCGHSASGTMGELFGSNFKATILRVKGNHFKAGCNAGLGGIGGGGEFSGNRAEGTLGGFGTQTGVNFFATFSVGSGNELSVHHNYFQPGVVSGVLLDGANVHFTENTIYDVSPAYTSGYGIDVSGSGATLSNRISGNYIKQISGTVTMGIRLSGASPFSVGNNKIDIIAGVGIGQNSTVDSPTVIGNSIVVSGTATYGISLPGSHAIIQGNFIDLNGTGTGIDGGQIISGNKILDAATIGITTGCQRCAISGNVIDIGNSGTGIDVANTGLATVIGNHIYGGLIGIDLTACTKFTCFGNFMEIYPQNNSKGIDASRGSLTSLYGSITGNTIMTTGSGSGRKGIDLTFVDDCAVSGNIIGEGNAWNDHIDVTSCGNHVGLGKDTTENTDTYNLYRTS
jgi:hypothetical protein